MKNAEQFIENSKKMHGNKYDYSLVDYKKNNIKVKIICIKHGIFEQTPNDHKKCGCPKCHKIQLGDFIVRANKIHNNLYNYDLVTEIKNNKQKIKIKCLKHGLFEQYVFVHLNGSGCKKCSDESFATKTHEFIKNAKKMHGDKYDYLLVYYKNAHTKVKIICPIHGEFEQIPNSHLNGHGCPRCGGTNKKTKEEFIEQSKKINNLKFDYSLVEYINDKKKIKLRCIEHNIIFEVTPNQHLKQKYGCSICNNRNHRLNKIKRVEENKSNNYPLAPLFNKKACEIFNNISKNENIHIQHAMNGGEYYIKELGYWLDGYDEINNTAYEYDEKYHFIKGKLREKDIIRQYEIEKFLGCKFIRIRDL